MYRITDLSFESEAPDGKVRADDVFYPTATVCYRGVGEAPQAEAVLAIDGKTVAAEDIQLDRGECITIEPPGAPHAGPKLADADWLAVYEDGAVVTTKTGTVQATVTVADQRIEVDLPVKPTRGRVQTGTPIED